MAIDCRCPSCGAVLRIAERHAGREVKCPACAGVVAVPSVGGKKGLPVAKRIEPDREPPPEVTKQVADRADPPIGHAAGGFPDLVVDPTPLRPSPDGSFRRKTSWPLWLPATIAATALLAVVLGAVLIHRHAGDSLSPEAEQQAVLLEAEQEAVLLIDLPGDQRREASVFIDGRKRELPPTGAVEFSLKPGRHRIVLRRPGYQQVEARISLKADQRYPYEPTWVPAEVVVAEPQPAARPPGAWLQDMEVAKRRAADANKDIFVAFEGSDWAEPSIRLHRDIFSQRAFREQMEWRFVLVSIDFPQEAEAKARVEDPERNQQLAQSYHVSTYPTLVLTDAEGRPYAVTGYQAGDLETLVEFVATMQGIRERRDRLFIGIEMARGDEKLAAIKEAAALLKDMRLAHFYMPLLGDWLALTQQQDPDNQKGAHEAVFEVNWLAHLTVVDRQDVDQIQQVVSELDDWKKQYEFRDPDRAAWMHLYAGIYLSAVGQSSEALAYIEQASACGPKDPALVAILEMADASLRGYGTGTGFAVTADGHILTCYHVIEGIKRNSVRLPDRDQPVPAEVVAQDARRDLALLKIKLPEGIELRGLRITAGEVRRGAGVGVFGFPSGELLGTGVKLTTGVVSAVPDQSEQKAYLLDCRVNPGNSGGPLCDTRGNVIGMVTAKFSGFGLDSYGTALPGKDLLAFLEEHLPDYGRQQTVEAGQTRLEWDEIDQIVSPSVVMIVGSQ